MQEEIFEAKVFSCGCKIMESVTQEAENLQIFYFTKLVAVSKANSS
ncbi:hypothetical protein NOC27_292 [Nitrosococcus oceani AFC27]|nr:hypothetical protein NOC27_292 [Nitrosococcus oceani AFC27]